MKRTIPRLLGLLAASVLRPSALLDPGVRRRLWKHHIAAQPQGFYASIFDPAELTGDDAAQPTPGLFLNPAGHRRLLTEVFAGFRDEFTRIPVGRPAAWADHPRFFMENDAFHGIDAFAYWAIVRAFRPRRIVEIGFGFTTLLAAEAVAANGHGRVTAIDPFPRDFLRPDQLGVELLRQPAERLDPGYFDGLEPNDIVFVDSTHVVRTGGDVTWFFLQVLPRLAPGVLVHVHDIHLPFEYPTDLITDRNVYWTEQYLLHAYLLRNSVDEVLFGSRYASAFLREETAAAFPTVAVLGGGSFWLRTGPVPRPAG